MPTATMALPSPAPNTAVSMIAVRIAGNASMKSAVRMISPCTRPGLAAARSPSSSPAPSPMPTAITPASSDACAPSSSSEATSRPKASVPSQCAAEDDSSTASMSRSSGP